MCPHDAQCETAYLPSGKSMQYCGTWNAPVLCSILVVRHHHHHHHPRHPQGRQAELLRGPYTQYGNLLNVFDHGLRLTEAIDFRTERAQATFDGLPTFIHDHCTQLALRGVGPASGWLKLRSHLHVLEATIAIVIAAI